MPRVQPVEPEAAPSRSQELAEKGKKEAGKVLNFHRQMSVSPAAFKSYMDFAETMRGGALDRRTQEAVAVAVSDFNGCKY